MEPRRHIGIPKYLADAIDAQLWTDVRKMLRRYGPAGFVEPECMRAPMKEAA
jgi:hypothetical protein